jgi:hypothetical protein
VLNAFGVVWRRFDGQSQCRVRPGFAKTVPPILAGITMTLATWNREVQNAAMHTPSHAMKRQIVLPPCFPGAASRAGKQVPRTRDLLNIFIFIEETGAGEGIRTLDPNLGKVVLYP